MGENPAALRAAVFLLSSKNLRGGVQTPPPPSRARVNVLSNAVFRFALRYAGAEIDGEFSPPPPPSGVGKSRGPSGCGLNKKGLSTITSLI